MKRKTMKKLKRMRLWLVLAAVLAVGVFTTTKASATLSLIKSNETVDVSQGLFSEISVTAQREANSKSRAPEPSTMALFGGGILGMIISFLRRAYLVLKRAFDICAAIIGIILTVPLFLLAAILVKATSKGPIFYSQVRVGQGGRLFSIYKFRTMTVDAEKASGPVWAKKNDNRITPVGHFLRKTRIDELPQFFNILKDDMSLIGPRPERPVFVEQFKKEITDYEKRLNVKPGLTGLAQVWHRYDETIQDVKKKLRYDLLYINKMSFWADFEIVLRTFRVVFTGHGAR